MKWYVVALLMVVALSESMAQSRYWTPPKYDFRRPSARPRPAGKLAVDLGTKAQAKANLVILEQFVKLIARRTASLEIVDNGDRKVAYAAELFAHLPPNRREALEAVAAKYGGIVPMPDLFDVVAK